MKRHTSTVLLAALGLTLAHGCSSNDDDDSGLTATSTTGGTVTSTASGATGSSGGSSANGSVTGSSTTGNDTNSSGGGNGGTGGGGQTLEEACPDLAAQCGAENLQSQTKEINMLIVLDKSGSMNFEEGGQSRWDAMKEALSTALRTPSAENIEFGLWLYPFPDTGDDPIDAIDCGVDNNCCDMPSSSDPQVGIGEGAAQVETVLDDTEPGGGTPTAVALERALDYFTNGPGGNLSGEKYVLLATDGGPNCNAGLTCGADVCTANMDGRTCEDVPQNNCCDEDLTGGDGSQCLDDSNVVDQIEALKDEGIDTFVVGIPGSEAYSSYLDAFAEAGGRAVNGDYSYYRVDDVNDLADTFTEITVQLVTSCDLTFDDAPAEQPKVAINCEIVNRFDEGGEAGAGNSGEVENWSWDGQSSTLTLEGDVCDMVASGVERVDVLFNCPEVN